MGPRFRGGVIDFPDWSPYHGIKVALPGAGCHTLRVRLEMEET